MAVNTKIPQATGDPNDMIVVSRGVSDFVTDNFRESELFNPNNGLDFHPFSLTTTKALQALRTRLGVPIGVNSTYRNYVPSGAGVVDAASRSPHMLGHAVDFRFLTDTKTRDELLVALREDFANKGDIFQMLWELGVRGYGVYDTFIHLDTVKSELYADFRNKRSDQYQGQKYAYWNKQKTLRYRKTDDGALSTTLKEALGILPGLLSEVMEGEDRGTDITAALLWKIVAIIALPTSLVLLWLYVKRKFL